MTRYWYREHKRHITVYKFDGKWWCQPAYLDCYDPWVETSEPCLQDFTEVDEATGMKYKEMEMQQKDNLRMNLFYL